MRQPVWVDVDADGDLDLFVAFRDRANALFLNDGGRFTDIAPRVGLADTRRSVGAVWFDYDQDGDLDLYVANQDGDANGLFRHDRRGTASTFTDVAAATQTEWAGRAPREATNGTVRPCAFDVDGDGWLDLFGANYGPNGVLLLDRSGKARDASKRLGVATDGRFDTCAPADVDNDGRVDFYVNGTITGGVAHRDYLFRHGGDVFSDATPEAVRTLPASHGASWADVDADGDLDLALAGTTAEQMPLLLRNQLPSATAARSLKIRVLDGSGRATRAGCRSASVPGRHDAAPQHGTRGCRQRLQLTKRPAGAHRRGKRQPRGRAGHLPCRRQTHGDLAAERLACVGGPAPDSHALSDVVKLKGRRQVQ